MVYIFLADGFEECEALVPLDILRRGGIEVNTVGIGKNSVTGAHGITVTADIAESDAVLGGIDAVILPGGMPGTLNLEKSETVQKFIDFAAEKGALLCAICAAPSVFGHKGLLNGKKATCFPGFEKDLIGAKVLDVKTVTDGNVITACGAGAAFEFGFAVLTALTGDKTAAENLSKAMKYTK